MVGKKAILSQKEAERLLNMLKKTLVDSINFPEKGKSIEFEVLGDTKGDRFIIKIFRGKIKHNKYNFGARIQCDNTILLELHVGSTNVHTNPDGQKIIGTHWHIYKEGYDRKYAYNATDIDDNMFVDNTIKFFDKFNLIEKPIVNYQMELI